MHRQCRWLYLSLGSLKLELPLTISDQSFEVSHGSRRGHAKGWALSILILARFYLIKPNSTRLSCRYTGSTPGMMPHENIDLHNIERMVYSHGPDVF